MTRSPTGDDLLAVLHDAADAVHRALGSLDDWGLAGTRSGQYHSDLAADEACLAVLDAAGMGWLSEESGVAHAERELIAIVDPVDGSTNASRGIPWYATSICVLEGGEPRAALVANQASGRRYWATAGGGAFLDGVPISPTRATDLRSSIVGLSGYPPTYLGWKQFRALGAAALDLCAVAAGTLDAYLDCSPSAHGSWDYAAGMLVCTEAGAVVCDAFGRSLVTLDHLERRTPVAAATAELAAAAVAARRSLAWPNDPVDS